MDVKTLSRYIAWCELYGTKASFVGLGIFKRLQEVSQRAK